MKQLIGGFILIMAVQNANSQTMDEWFKQKKTQKKYLLQQIQAFRQYAGYIKKGIDITQSGLQTIGNLKNGDFNLHNHFFNSLQSVNPKIKNYSKVAHIMSMQVNIIMVYNRIYKRVKATSHFNQMEVRYIYRVFTELLSKTADNIEELTEVISNRKMDMKDDERLQKIGQLYDDTLDKWCFTQHFANEITVLTIDRLKEKNDVQKARLMNSIK